MRRRVPQHWCRRLLAALMLVAFLPVVSAALLCEVHCAAKAASNGHEGTGHDDAVDDPSEHAFGGHLHDAGRCHLATTTLAAADSDLAWPSRASRDHWLPVAGRRLTSVVWPPPRPRPRAIVS